MSYSDYLETETLGWLFGQTSYYVPWISVGLSASDPGDDGYFLDEPWSFWGYSRIQTEIFDWEYVPGFDNKITNSVELLFDEATDDWGIISHFVLFDEDYYGEMLLSGELETYRDVTAGHRVSFVPGQLEITLD